MAVNELDEPAAFGVRIDQYNRFYSSYFIRIFHFTSAILPQYKYVKKVIKDGAVEGATAYQLGNTSSRMITEVKQHLARLVLGWRLFKCCLSALSRLDLNCCILYWLLALC